MSVRKSDTGVKNLERVQDISPKPSRTFNPATFIGFSNDGKKIIYYTRVEGQNAADMILQDVKGSTKETIPLPVLPSFIQATPDGRRCVLFSNPEVQPFRCFEYNFDQPGGFVEIQMTNDDFFDGQDYESFELLCKFENHGNLLAMPGKNKDFLVWGANVQTFNRRLRKLGHSSDNRDCICEHGDVGFPVEVARQCPVQGHNDDVTSVAFGPVNRTMATASGDPCWIKLWEITPRGLILKEDLWKDRDGNVYDMAFAPSGRILAFGIQNAVYLLDLVTKNYMGIEILGYPIIAWSPDGKCLACATTNPRKQGEYSVYLFDTKTWSLKKTLLQKFIPGHEDWSEVQRLAFSPDSSMLACQCGDTEMTVWFRQHLINSAMKRVSKNMPWETGRFKDMEPGVWAENFIETEW